MNMWPEVGRLKDGDNVDAKTLNKPINQLASRTDYLKDKLDTIGDKSAVILTDVPIASDLEVGQAVYFHSAKDPLSDQDIHEFRKAQATMDLYDDFKASDSAFTVGILVSRQGGIGNVIVSGRISLKTFDKASFLQSGETFRSGRYYLSATEAGKLTSNPSGPLIYVGTFQSNGSNDQVFTSESVAFVNPQFLDIGTSHVHRAYPLVARPAGWLDGSDVIGYLPTGSEPHTLSSDPAGSSSDQRTTAPSLIFGGTWTSEKDVVYKFSLNGNEWGTVQLTWTRDGVSKESYSREIPAPGVFVDVGDGLKVKVLFPGADSLEAYPCGMDYSWDPLVFPYAGKGWVNHEVSATAESVGSRVKANISGSWDNGANATVMFGKDVYTRIFKQGIAANDTVTIGDVEYRFLQDPTEPTHVQLAATTEESLKNLAKLANGPNPPSLFYRDGLLVSCGRTISDGKKIPVELEEGQTGFYLVGGKVPVMLVYGNEFRLWGDPVANHDCYTPARVGPLYVTLYAPGAKKQNENNVFVTFDEDLRLTATAYDHEPQAVYDYAMGLHQEIDYYFPPVPAKSAGLFVNGVEMENKALFRDNPTYSIGHATIHWMADKLGRLPWPNGISHHDDTVLPKDDKTMAFYFNVGFQCANGPVTSLVPVPGSNVKLYTHGTNDTAYTGDLMIDVACDFEVSDKGLPGYIVPKQGRNGKLLAGAVVERIKAGPGIVVTQKRGCPGGQGTVTVSLDNGSLSGQFSEIALENAKQEKIGLFPYVSLLGWTTSSTNIPSAFTAMMRVPANLEATKEYRLQVKTVVFGMASYGPSDKRLAAGITLEYNILPDYTNDTHRSLKNGLIVPDSPRRIAIPFGHETSSGVWSYSAFDPFVLTTDDGREDIPDVRVEALQGAIPQASEFTQEVTGLKPGYLVALRFARADNPDPANFDSYVGGIGFLSLEWSLEED